MTNQNDIINGGIEQVALVLKAFRIGTKFAYIVVIDKSLVRLLDFVGIVHPKMGRFHVTAWMMILEFPERRQEILIENGEILFSGKRISNSRIALKTTLL